MDFVIVGIVIGAIIVLCGAAIRDIGPRLRPRFLRDDLPEVLPEKAASAWKRYCIAVGSLISTGGMLMVLVTVLGITFDVDDTTGTNIVLASGVVALACVALAGLVVTPHYRRGGFFSRPRSAQDVEERAVLIPAPEAVAPVVADDPFVVDEFPDEPAVVQEDMEAPLVTVADPRPVAGMPREPSEPAPGPVTRVTSPERRRPVDRAESAPAPRPGRPRVPDAPQPRERSRVADRRMPVEPEPLPPAPSPATVERAPMRYEPLDDDLPAWNAPVVSESEPAPEPGGSDESLPQAEPRTGEAGFASSIFTDLDVPAAADDVPAGPFKSRLLNELTREAASAQPEPVIDVLLDEFPLPGDRRIPDRDAEKDQ